MTRAPRANAEILFIPNRELRTIPRGWQHPRTPDGRYQPLLPADYEFEADQAPFPKMPATWNLPAPDTEIAAYESCTEGTPISPAFPNTLEGRRDLVRYCAEHETVFGKRRAGAEAWAALLFGADAAVTTDGRVIAQGR